MGWAVAEASDGQLVSLSALLFNYPPLCPLARPPGLLRSSIKVAVPGFSVDAIIWAAQFAQSFHVAVDHHSANSRPTGRLTENSDVDRPCGQTIAHFGLYFN